VITTPRPRRCTWMALAALACMPVCLPPFLALANSTRTSSSNSGDAASPTPPPAPQEPSVAAQRLALHKLLDEATDTHGGVIHDACGSLMDVGDASSVPHLIRVLRFFGDAELPLPPGVGLVCTHWHCVNALEKITGAKVGISYASWKRWWDTTHPGQPLEGLPPKKLHLPVARRSRC